MICIHRGLTHRFTGTWNNAFLEVVVELDDVLKGKVRKIGDKFPFVLKES